nr:SWIM zinc finger domain-containing protein [Anaerolineae bacterium]
MRDFPHLTETDVRRLAIPQSFERGESYYLSGAVFDTQRRGNTLTAQVEGSQYRPYRVTVTLDPAGVQDASCTCPYDWGGVCKHIVAVLLTYIREPDAFAVRPEPSDLLTDLDAETMRALLTDLLTGHPDLQDEVEAWLTVRQAQAALSESKPRKRRSPLDPALIRRRVLGILHSLDGLRHSEAYWEVSGMVSQLRQVLQEARDFLAADDAESALVILQVLGEEVIETYPEFEYAETDVAEFIEDVGEPLAEALLACDLTPDRRREWEDKLTRWAEHLDGYGIEEAMDLALAALCGWDAEPKEDEEEFAADLTDAKLNILERRGQTGAFLALALETGRHLRYAIKLVDLGRVREAVDYALAHFTQAEEGLAMAQHLRKAGNLEGALTVAERGLGLEGYRHRLGVWLSDAAASLGRGDLAVRARIVAFESCPSLENYQAVRRLAGDRWPELQSRLMETARASGVPDALVDILLHEGQVDEAIAVADREAWNYHLLGKVADAAVATHPDWVIRVSQGQAEGLINRVQSKYYAAAVRWLKKARAAYRAAGRETEWRAYLTDLRQRHARKRTLMGMLKGME